MVTGRFSRLRLAVSNTTTARNCGGKKSIAFTQSQSLAGWSDLRNNGNTYSRCRYKYVVYDQAECLPIYRLIRV